MRYAYFLLFVLLFSCEPTQEEGYIPEKNQPPSAFEINHIIAKEDLATLSWTKAVDPDGDKVTYSVFRDETLVVEELTATYYTFANLKSGTKYSGKIIASDEEDATSEISYEFTTKGTADNSGNNGGSSGNFGSTGDNSGSANDTSNFKIPDNLKSYYKDIDFSLRGNKLRDELATLVIGTHKNFLEYRERHKYLKQATDPKNSRNVLLIYTGESVSKNSNSFNTEHVFPKSRLDKDGRAPNDVHNFYYCREKVNTARGNKSFAKGSGGYKDMGSTWYPGDDWRGDVARIFFYINLRYDEPFTDACAGGVSLLLEWNAKDPVSEIEKIRNNIFQEGQGNRNPFIDNPYLANLIWDGQKAENLWK